MDKKKTLGELLLEKSVVLESDNLLKEAISAAEKTIFSKILNILRGLAQREGMLRRDTLNRSLLRKLEKEILKAIRESTLEKKINDFLPNFDKIEKLNELIYSNILGRDFTKKVKNEIGVLKTIQIEKITKGILSVESLNVNFTSPIRQILFNGIATRQSSKDVEDALRLLIKGDENSKGTFRRYITQIVRDSLNQSDGATQDLVRDTYQLDGFMYVGGLVKRSRDNCEDLVRGNGRFAEFAIERGLYRVVDIPAIIEKARKGKGSGWNSLTTAETFGQYRGGYNCLHQIVYLPLSEEQKIKEINQTFD